MRTDTLRYTDGLALLPRGSRMMLVMGVAALHVLAVWGLLRLTVAPAVEPARPPVEIEWISDGQATAPSLPPRVESPPQTAVPVKPVKTAPERIIAAKQSVPAAEKFSAPAPVAHEPAPAQASPQPAAAPVSPSAGDGQPRSIGISAIRYRNKPQAEYPSMSRELGESGTVSIRVVIGSDGRVQSAQAVKSSGFRRLDDAALRAARQASFYPYQENGVAVAAAVTIPFNFNFKKPAVRGRDDANAAPVSQQENRDSASAGESNQIKDKE